MLTQLNFLISTGIYSGLSPTMPGTCGSIAFIGAWLTAQWLAPASATTWIIITCVITVVGTLSTAHTVDNHSFFKEDKKDPSAVVVDEWCGQSIALIGTAPDQPLYVLGAFLLFRFFDITKPFPVSRAENLPGAAGIMADDLVAGGLALACLQLLKAVL